MPNEETLTDSPSGREIDLGQQMSDLIRERDALGVRVFDLETKITGMEFLINEAERERDEARREIVSLKTAVTAAETIARNERAAREFVPKYPDLSAALDEARRQRDALARVWSMVPDETRQRIFAALPDGDVVEAALTKAGRQ